MRLKELLNKIQLQVDCKYEIDNNCEYRNNLLELSGDDKESIDLLRIRRISKDDIGWKTIAISELNVIELAEFKKDLKKVISWVASIKQSLAGNESSDLYLFLVINGNIGVDERIRIESTEQFCRKYVLLPDEDIFEFLNRTFLQKIINSVDESVATDPIEIAFSKTMANHNWLTVDIQKKWKRAFMELAGSELVTELLEKGELK